MQLRRQMCEVLGSILKHQQKQMSKLKWLSCVSSWGGGVLSIQLNFTLKASCVK